MVGRRRVLGSLLVMMGCSASPTSNTGSTSTSTSTSSGTIASSTGANTTGPVVDSTAGSSAEGSTTAPPGELRVLTYNVAGLPQGISGSDPENNIPQISPLLDAYDMVLVQEDFWYHELLTAEVTLPYASEPWSDMPTFEDIGDGLNRFGIHPFAEHERVGWYDCHGQIDCASDCLATKGWSVARITVDEGVELDVYNLHMEAGGCPEDLEIRINAAQDLVAEIGMRSAGRALVVAGDFNLNAEDPEDVEALGIIMDGAQLIDACDAVGCGDQRIDHVMIRSGDALELEVLEWQVPGEFVDGRTGEPLSDHLPVAVRLGYQPQ